MSENLSISIASTKTEIHANLSTFFKKEEFLPFQQELLLKSAIVKSWTIGAVIPNCPDRQYLILSGSVRCVFSDGKDVCLQSGDWLGGFVAFEDCKFRVASQTAAIAQWDAKQRDSWKLLKFLSSRHKQPCRQLQQEPERVSVQGYPFVSGVYTGAACLTMALQFFDAGVSFEVVKKQCSEESLQNIAQAAAALGLTMRRVSSRWEDLSRFSVPFLLRWHQSHWVIVYAVRGKSLLLSDPLSPAQSCEQIPRSLVESAWDGQLWLLEINPNQEQFNLSWFLPAVRKHWRLFAEVLCASVVLQILGLTTPVLNQVVIDRVMVNHSLATLDVVAVALFGVAIFEVILGGLRSFMFSHTAQRIDVALTGQLFRHLIRLPLAYFESRRVGDTLARVQELETIRRFITGTALTVILDAIFGVAYLGMMLVYSVPLTLASLSVLPFFAILSLVATPLLRKWLNETFNRSADTQSFLVEVLNGIQSVKANSAELAVRERWEGLFARYVRMNFKSQTASTISGQLADFLTSFSALLNLYLGARLVIEGKLTIGELIAFQMFSQRMSGPLLRLIQLWQNFQQVLLSVDRIGDVLNTPSEPEGTGLLSPKLKGQVTFEQVFFRYRPEQDPILKGVSFTVQPGMFVGVVGRSGSGKSTLSKLLQRLYSPDSGRILIDGLDIKHLDPVRLRSQIAVVLQEDFLFNGSFVENIVLGKSGVSPADVVQASRFASAHDFISQKGYESGVGERGSALSGGQRQRVALARMFLNVSVTHAPIVMLDEATSALDSATEQKVLTSLREVLRDRTLFMVCHRFSALQSADLILVLDQGILVEQGTHDELLARQGSYYALYHLQHLQS